MTSKLLHTRALQLVVSFSGDGTVLTTLCAENLCITALHMTRALHDLTLFFGFLFCDQRRQAMNSKVLRTRALHLVVYLSNFGGVVTSPCGENLRIPAFHMARALHDLRLFFVLLLSMVAAGIARWV